MDANVRRHGVLLVLQRMLGQTASPERLKQLLDVVPEEAADRRIANPDEAVFTGLYLVNAAQRRGSNSASITQESAYLRAHAQAATQRRNSADQRFPLRPSPLS